MNQYLIEVWHKSANAATYYLVYSDNYLSAELQLRSLIKETMGEDFLAETLFINKTIGV